MTKQNRILICTQKVDREDPILGFFHDWIEEFSKNYQSVTVICLQKGLDNLPKNVEVLSLGKEAGVSRFKYIFNFYKYIFLERKKYDSVFVHMNQIYVILGSVFWKFQNKKIALWYMHKKITFSLRLALLLVDKVFTGSKNSSPIISKKVSVLGHGINTARFPFVKKDFSFEKLKLIVVGRISRVKGYEYLINSLKMLGENFNLKIVGGTIYESDEIYLNELKNTVAKSQISEKIEFVGPVSNYKISDYLVSSNFFVSNSMTGSLDKAILEAMSSGCIPLVCSLGNKDALGEYADFLFYDQSDPKSLTEKLRVLREIDTLKLEKISQALSAEVEKNHSLVNLAKKISSEI